MTTDVHLDRHQRVSEQVPDVLRAVADHHRPDPSDRSTRLRHCTGCDPSAGYSDEPAEWPCSTFLMIERQETSP